MGHENTKKKSRLNELLQTCQSEIKRTTKIGMKMLSASQSNSQLHDTYEALGQWLKEAVENGKIKVDESEVASLIAKAQELEAAMESLEKEVQDIKKEEL